MGLTGAEDVMPAPGWRQALERLVLHLLFCLVAVVLGYGFAMFGSLGVSQSRVPPWIPEGISWFGLSVIFAGFVIAGWCGSWVAYSWVIFFAAGMIPMTEYRIEIHRAAPLILLLAASALVLGFSDRKG
jgi:hypothetical protein